MNTTTFTVLTYNIDRNEYDLLDRLAALLKLIENTQPDFILFQEVTRISLEKLAREMRVWGYKKYIPEHFFNVQRPYFEVIFTKLPVKKPVFQEFRLSTDRRGLGCVCVEVWGKKDLWIVTTQYDALATRKKDEIADTDLLLKRVGIDEDCTVIFGLDSGILEYQRTLGCPNGWMDAWYEAGTDNEKYTVDYEKNPFVPKPNRDRPDRIWFRGDSLLCKSTKLFGEDSELVISSHYGVICEFEVK